MSRFSRASVSEGPDIHILKQTFLSDSERKLRFTTEIRRRGSVLLKQFFGSSTAENPPGSALSQAMRKDFGPPQSVSLPVSKVLTISKLKRFV